VLGDGSHPFSRGEIGNSTWQRLNHELRITAYASGRGNDVGIECVMPNNRSSDRCYTESAAEQRAAPGHMGGPLLIKVKHKNILIRGFCRKGNPLCTPHRVKPFL
jgi:hypothetical protein